MKKALLICVLSLTFGSSCSLLQRHDEAEEGDYEARGTLEEASPSPPMDTEISRLNTKIAALETKVEVLSSNMERMNLRNSQPVIEASGVPQQNMAAPVDFEAETQDSQVSSAPIRASDLPNVVKAVGQEGNGPAEREFRSAMELFQGGRFLEASSRFALISKKFPSHLLAAHSLYWAGEAGARGQQWSLAIENWDELEKKYPRSAYIPDALAGLARAHEAQGNQSMAMKYRGTLLRAFPKAPVALSLQTDNEPSSNMSQGSAPGEESIPVYEDNATEGELE